MSKCESCFHYRVCDCDVGFGYKDCAFFAPYDDTAIVVRCKDCMYSSFVLNTTNLIIKITLIN